MVIGPPDHVCLLLERLKVMLAAPPSLFKGKIPRLPGIFCGGRAGRGSGSGVGRSRPQRRQNGVVTSRYPVRPARSNDKRWFAVSAPPVQGRTQVSVSRMFIGPAPGPVPASRLAPVTSRPDASFRSPGPRIAVVAGSVCGGAPPNKKAWASDGARPSSFVVLSES